MSSIVVAGDTSGSVTLSAPAVAGSVTTTNGGTSFFAGNSPALAGALDRVRITTVNGTDTFDAGSVNILYE